MFGDTPLVMVEDAETLVRVSAHLRSCPVIGVDTEADSFHHYQEKLCLVQISDLHTDYILDPLKVADLAPLKAVLEDARVVKVLHGGDYDVVSLKRDHGIAIRNVFDTMIAAQFLGLPRFGLADLIERHFGHQVDKKFQRHDWARRPLLSEHLDYARGDTHFLLALREVLSLRLRRKGRLAAHAEECEHLERREWTRQDDPETAFWRVKGSNTLDGDGRRVLRGLWAYRDEEARRLDRPAFKVMPDDMLIRLAADRPTTEAALGQVVRSSSSLARRHGDALLKVIEEGLADARPVPPPPKKERRADDADSGGPGVDRLLVPLKEWRNAWVSRTGLNPVVVASNGLLKEIARAAPTDVDALARVPGIRAWQVKDLGEELVAVVRAVGPSGAPPSAKKGRRRRR